MQMENYVFFKTNDSQTIELLMVLVAQGRASIVDEKDGIQVQVCRKSDAGIVEAIKRVVKDFVAKAQWVAIYRVLVDYHDFPSGYKDFYERITEMMPHYASSHPCDEQAIQKGMLSSAILAKPYEKWKEYKPKKNERAFIRHKRTADRFLELLNNLTLR